MSNKLRRVKTISVNTKFVDNSKDAGQVIADNTECVESYYNAKGYDTDNDGLACAKILSWPNSRNENNDRFYIRVYNSGMDLNKAYHPINNPEVNLNRRTKNGNESMYKWRVVTEENFNLYLSFLVTKNPLAYEKLERELLNG